MTASDALRIAALTAADAQAFRSLRLAALQGRPEAFGASYADEAAAPLAAFAERIAPAPPSRIYGAFLERDLVGMAGFLAATSTKTRHRGTLWGVHVAQEQRGRGIARRLVENVIAHAGHHVLVLQARVVTGNEVARTLYERLGFRSYGVEAKALCVDGVFYDEALLALDFPQAPTPPSLRA